MSDVTPPNAEKPSFIMPKLHPGMSVDIAFTNVFSHPMLGIICKPKAHSASVLVFTPDGPKLYFDCRHKDDPWLVEHTDWLAGDQESRAIFDVSTAERERLATIETVKRCLELVQQLSAEVAALKESSGAKVAAPVTYDNDLEGAFSEPRPRGRPRKLQPIEG